MKQGKDSHLHLSRTKRVILGKTIWMMCRSRNSPVIQGDQGSPTQLNIYGEEFLDGGGLCNPGRCHPSKRMGQNPFGLKLRGILMEETAADTREGLSDPRDKLFFKLCPGQGTEDIFSKELIGRIRSRWADLLPVPNGALEVSEPQPFFLGLMGQT